MPKLDYGTIVHIVLGAVLGIATVLGGVWAISIAKTYGSMGIIAIYCFTAAMPHFVFLLWQYSELVHGEDPRETVMDLIEFYLAYTLGLGFTATWFCLMLTPYY